MRPSLLLVLAVLAAPVAAQTNGSITGHVRQRDGAAIVGAQVGLDGRWLALTDTAGFYRIREVRSGWHLVTVRAIGAVPVEVPLSEARGFALRWADLEPHVSSQTRAVVVCTPSNPTGAVVERDEMMRIVRELAARRVVLLADETYARFVYGGEFWSVASLPEWRENVILTSTFSKSFGMTGWRVGYLLADKRVTEQAIKIQDAMVICAPVVSQIAVEAAIRHAWDYPLSFHEELIARRRVLVDGLRSIPRLHWTPTGGAFFAFVRVNGSADSERLSRDILEREHVVTIPGASFGQGGEGFIRLSYGASGQDELREALGRLGRYFDMMNE